MERELEEPELEQILDQIIRILIEDARLENGENIEAQIKYIRTRTPQSAISDVDKRDSKLADDFKSS